MTTKNDVTRTTALYIPADFYMIRAPALPAYTFQQLSAVRTAERIRVSDLEAWVQTQSIATQQQLLAMSNDPQIEQAIAVASSSLHADLVQLRNGEGSTSRTKKVSSSLLRYIIRMSTRPTPFGLFSGVALGSFGEETHAQLDIPTIGRFRTRPDMNWLLAVLKKIEASPVLVAQLSIYTNQMASIAGGRVYLPHTDTYGQKKNQAVSLRATPVVCKALDLARQPLPYIELRDALLQVFSGATIQQVEQLLWQLWEYGLLLSTLHPPLTNTQPMRYLYQQCEKLHGTEDMRRLLDEVHAKSSLLDNIGIGGKIDSLAKLVQAQEALVPGEKQHPQIQVDSMLSLPLSTLHNRIGDVAARAAELLLRVTPFPEGSIKLKEYRKLFLEKYGSNTDVPLLELLSPERGLDAPPGYVQPPRAYNANQSYQRPPHERRELILHALVQEALNSHKLEIELTETHLAALETWSPNLKQAPCTLEIYLQVQATSQKALDHGQWCAVVSPNPGTFGGGYSFGRFLDLLGEPGKSAVQSLLAREETISGDVLFAELSYQPDQARNANVAIRPCLRTYEIAVGTTPTVPPEYVIPLSDLVVSIQNDHFFLRSLRHNNKRVIVRQLHMLNPHQAPNVCRFLMAVSSDGLPVLTSFDWGSLSCAPFLPRIIVQQSPQARIVLTPARWHLQATTLQPRGEGNAETRWFSGLQSWRKQWRIPRYVYLTEADNRLLLDLEHPLMAAELFKELGQLKEDQQITIQELLPDFDHLWLTDSQNKHYFSEIVVPLLRRDALEPEAPVKAVPQACISVPHIVSPQERVFYPGDAWNYIKLYCTMAQQEEIMAGPLRELVRQLREQHFIDRWFFIRYADPQPHLRLRIHTSVSEQVQPALNLLLSWSRQLATHGLIQRSTLDTYEREVARYGGPAAIDLLEQIFSIDSDVCSNLIAARYGHHLILDPLAIAVNSLDRFFSAWNDNVDHRLQWLQKRTEKYAFRKEFHHERKRYCDLLVLSDEHGDPESIAQRTILRALTIPLENQLPPLAAQVRALDHAGKLWVKEDDLLASLAHMHVVRLLGLDANKEQQIYAFWHHTLESIRLYPTQ